MYKPAFPKPDDEKKLKKALIKQCDRLWKDIILLSEPYCGWCKKPHKFYQAHHIFSRGKWATRYVIINGIKLGQGCHRSAHQENAMDFADFIREKLGDKYVFLKVRSNGVFKKTVENFQLMKNQLLSIYKQL